MSQRKDHPLELDAESMRRLGYQAVDLVVAHYCDVRAQPVVPDNRDAGALPDELMRFAEDGRDPEDLLREVLPAVFDQSMHLIHPRFFAYIPGPANFVSALADLLTAGFNVFAGTTPNNQGPYDVERSTIAWLCDLAGLGDAAGGLFVSGGSMATMTALAAARHTVLGDAVEGALIYQSDHTHSSVERALFLLGFAPGQLQTLAAGDDCRLDCDALRARIRSDMTAGSRPFCVVANAGTTSSGAVDDLDAIAAICDEFGLWLHVDAAYGGGALLSSEKDRFAGIGRAHSISIDPHKWLFQPYESAVVLVREQNWLRQTFSRVPAYMRDTDTGPEQTNYRDMSPQVTRAFKALKLWLSLHTFGVRAFRDAVEAGLETARYAERQLRAVGHWQVVTPATLGIVTFRYLPPGLDDSASDELVTRIVQEVNSEGFAYLSSTELFGNRVLRFCPINPAVTPADIDQTIAVMTQAAHNALECMGTG